MRWRQASNYLCGLLYLAAAHSSVALVGRTDNGRTVSADAQRATSQRRYQSHREKVTTGVGGWSSTAPACDFYLVRFYLPRH